MGTIYQPQPLFGADLLPTVNPVTLDLNDSGDGVGVIFAAHKAGTIDRIVASVKSITGTSPVYDARLETVVANVPSGTLAAATTNATFTPVAGYNTITLTSGLSVSPGDIVAAVIVYSSGTIDVSNFAKFNFRVNRGNVASLPRVMQRTTSLWAPAANLSVTTALYSDGDAIIGTQPYSGITSRNVDSSSTPDEYAIEFTSPGDFTCHGVRIYIKANNSNGDFDLVLYNSGGTALGTVSVDADQLAEVSALDSVDCFFTAATLSSGSTYRVAIKPTNATQTVQLKEVAFENLAGIRSCFGDAGLVTRTDGGAWSARDNTAMIAISPLIRSVTAGGGSGGGIKLAGKGGGLVG